MHGRLVHGRPVHGRPVHGAGVKPGSWLAEQGRPPATHYQGACPVQPTGTDNTTWQLDCSGAKSRHGGQQHLPSPHHLPRASLPPTPPAHVTPGQCLGHTWPLRCPSRSFPGSFPDVEVDDALVIPCQQPPRAHLKLRLQGPDGGGERQVSRRGGPAPCPPPRPSLSRGGDDVVHQRAAWALTCRPLPTIAPAAAAGRGTPGRPRARG
ncbi:hypothetical protein V8C86DRAFT_763122 [Haematococcus lacustris]